MVDSINFCIIFAAKLLPNCKTKYNTMIENYDLAENSASEGYAPSSTNGQAYDNADNSQSYSPLDNLTDEEIEAAIDFEEQRLASQGFQPSALEERPYEAASVSHEASSHQEHIDLLTSQMIEPFTVTADLELPEVKPVVSLDDAVLCSEGNISAVVGEAKSKKTFLCTAIVGSLITANNDSRFGIKRNFCRVLWIDTEQSLEHIQKVLFRLNVLGEWQARFPNPLIRTLSVRSESPLQRLDLVEAAIRTHKPKLIVIDGISDLMSNSNNLEASEALVSLLLTWSTNYKCHIMNVLHTNPNSDKARGHLGSTLMRKAETVIFVHRAGEMSIVEPQYCRNMPFDRFAFAVENLPEVEQQSPACVGLGLPIECEMPNEQSEREDDCVRILRDDLGGCAERKLLCNMVAQKMGYTDVYSRVKVSRAIQRGLLHESSDKTVTVA